MDAGPLMDGEVRALAQAISAIEAGEAGSGELAAELWRRRGEGAQGARVVGLTGAPGSGKSTLAGALIELWRSWGRRVAVLAVDPNSPFTGGALLGDRVRMQHHALDHGVFIRSLGARGHVGGVSLATRGAVRLLDAMGWEMVLVETVGVGQSELEICEIADSVVVVAIPGTGDGVQAGKAGITEIADVFAVNKADLPGVERVSRELREMVRLSPSGGGWQTPVVRTVATQGGEGVVDLGRALEEHQHYLESSGELPERHRRRLHDEVVELVGLRARQFARGILEGDQGGLLPADVRRADPERAARMVLERLAAAGDAGAELPALAAGD